MLLRNVGSLTGPFVISHPGRRVVFFLTPVTRSCLMATHRNAASDPRMSPRCSGATTPEVPNVRRRSHSRL